MCPVLQMSSNLLAQKPRMEYPLISSFASQPVLVASSCSFMRIVCVISRQPAVMIRSQAFQLQSGRRVYKVLANRIF